MAILKKIMIRTLIGVGLAAVAFAGYYLFLSSSPRMVLTQEFLDARKHAAEVSGRIVELTNEIGEKVKDANLAQIEGRKVQALAAVRDARERNEEARRKAIELSSDLKRITESLADIASERSRGLAYEAVAIELALVSEFISYTDHLNSFLDTLALAVAEDTPAHRRAVEDALARVNEGAARINAINQEFLSKIGEFDASL